MKRLFTLAALAGALTAAACNDSQPQDQADMAPPEPMEATAADDAALDAAATTPSPVDAAPAAPGPDSSTLPADKKSSEESVQPESETLFY